jgi:hypothetical protein
MKMVLFDLGNTLESQDVLLPGARETLQAIEAMRDHDGNAVALALVSDFFMPSRPEEIPAIQQRYLDLLDDLGIRSFFEPVDARVTLSTTVGVFKPDRRIFEAVIAHSGLELTFSDIFFITENLEHVEAARRLGMRAVHFRGPGQTTGEVDELLDVTRLIEEFLQLPTARALLRMARSTALARCKLPPETHRARSDPAGSMAASWATFGDEVLLMTDRDWETLAQNAGRSLSELEELPSVARREHLHLVVQKGRLFQQTYPDVPVVLDRGRFLVIALAPEQARELGQRDAPCFTIQFLRDNQIVFEERSRDTFRFEPQAWIRTLLDRVSRDTLAADLNHLVSFPTRASTTAYYAEVADWARAQLATGYLTRTERFLINGQPSLNVVADKHGLRRGSRDVVLVVAHLDSVTHQHDPEAPAPGADDNASGSAGLLQMARVFKDHPAGHDLRFILFGGEEQGLLGSRHYLRHLPAEERGRIRAVINMDMIGTRNTAMDRAVLLEGADLSRGVLNGLERAGLTYTSLKIQISRMPAASDHVAFIQAGIPAVLTIEGADHTNTAIHSEHDTLDRIDYDLMLEIVRMNTAFVASALNLQSP